MVSSPAATPAQPLGGEHARFDVDRERDLLLRGEQCDLPEPAQVARDGVDVGGEGCRGAAVSPAAALMRRRPAWRPTCRG